ncbi:hypothetical protein [Paeniglutamicibacter cryotolerans]
MPHVVASLGWPSTVGATGTVTSNGTGYTSPMSSRSTKIGRLKITNTVSISLSTSGKMSFHPPVASTTSARKGQLIKVKKTAKNESTAWNQVISKCSYQWQRGTKNIKDATKLTYRTTSADVGKTLQLKTTCSPDSFFTKEPGITSNTKYSGAVKIRELEIAPIGAQSETNNRPPPRH